MKHLATPTIVIGTATTAMAATAALWHFNPTDAAAAVINKCEERLPQIFGNSTGYGLLGKLGKILCILSPNATTAIWNHVKTQQIARVGPSTRVPNSFDNMSKANLAWDIHYAKRIQQGCQRRDVHIYQTVNSTMQEIRELFTELDNASRLCIENNEALRLGIQGVPARIADEAGGVWYGPHCYAVVYKYSVC